MPDDAAPCPEIRSLARQPRAVGVARVSAKGRDGGSVLDGLFQSGASRVLLPRPVGPRLDAVSLNTAGGVTGGDRFALEASAGAGSHLGVTTQGAERIYRAQPGETAQVTTRLTVEAGARLDWLPQETILFEGAALTRRLTAELAEDACLLLVEPLVVGRTAMKEEVHAARLHDHLRIHRGGELVFADSIRLEGDIARHLDRSAIGGGARAAAAVLYVAPDAEARLDRLRSGLVGSAGASLIRPGVIFARILARDSYLLRKTLIPAIRQLSDTDLPRPWTL